METTPTADDTDMYKAHGNRYSGLATTDGQLTANK